MQHELGKIVWLTGETEAAPPCPVCGDDRPKTQVLETASLIEVQKTDPIRIVECPRCHTRYCTDLDVFEYELGANYHWSARFYVEQGASLDDLIDPIARLPEGGIESCLEIGCGFGFSLDAGRTLFGWRSVGVDPSPLARFGREALDIDIRPIYADVDTELGGPFDLVYGSEVIEHVAAPRDFLKICRAHLIPGGTLILSTPRGDVLGPDLSPALLMPILSPGHHLILFNAQSLDELVRTAGFTHTQVVVRAHNLMIYASDRPLAIDASKPLDRALYRSYLTAVLAKPGRPPELRTGLTYRLFKDLVNSGLYDQALPVFEDVVRDCRDRFGMELSPAAAEAAGAKIRKLEFDAPFCLPGIYFFRGIVALNASPDPGEAAAWFDAAQVAAQAFRAAYRTVGIDDGETGEIERLAPELALLGLCHSDPDTAVNRARRMAGKGTRLDTMFCRLVDLGHMRQAEMVEWAVDDNEGWHVTSRRAMLALLGSKDGRRAAALFGQALADPAAIPADERWRLEYHRILALITAGDGQGARRVASEMLAAGDSVPANIRELLDKLLGDHPTIRPAR